MSLWLFNIYLDRVVREVDMEMFGKGLNMVNADSKVDEKKGKLQSWMGVL